MSVWFTHVLILSGFKSSVKSRKLDATKQLYCTLSLCCNHGPSWTAYLPPSLHYSHHSEKWTQTGIDSVWVHRPTAFTRRGPEHLNISLAFFFFFFRPGPCFLISVHLTDWFWPKFHQLLYYRATYILFVWVQLSEELLKVPKYTSGWLLQSPAWKTMVVYRAAGKIWTFTCHLASLQIS